MLRQTGSNGLVVVNLKTKLKYRGNVYLKPVRPWFIVRILEYLKHSNELDRDRTIESAYILEYWLRACEQSSREKDILKKILEDLDHPMEVMLENEDKRTDDHNLKTIENFFDDFRVAIFWGSLVRKIFA